MTESKYLLDTIYLYYLTDELLSDLDGLIHPTKSMVSLGELKPFLKMIWIDHFDTLFDYFNFDWLKSDRKAIVYIATNHLDIPRPHGYPVPRITADERKAFKLVAGHLRELNNALGSLHAA